jgi:hypothetical protein
MTGDKPVFFIHLLPFFDQIDGVFPNLQTHIITNVHQPDSSNLVALTHKLGSLVEYRCILIQQRVVIRMRRKLTCIH